MKLYIINMLKDIERKEYITEQLKNLDITNYEFITAVYGKETMNSDNCDIESFKKYYVRDILPGEYGCAASHVKVYEKIIADGKPAMVIEDDVNFDAEIVNILKSKKNIPFEFDIIFLNKHHASNIIVTYGGTGILFDYVDFKFEQLHTNRLKIGLLPCWLGSSYIITPTAAQKVKDIQTPKINKLADSWYDFGLDKMFKSNKEFFTQNQAVFGSTIR